MLQLLIVCGLFLVGLNGLVVKPRQETSDSGRNINGLPAVQGEFPSQLSLRTYNIHTCGASIINAHWALTAAHCLTGSTIVGTTFFSGNIDLKGNGTIHPISEFIIHPDYVVFHEQENDIAVVKVTVPFDLDGVLRKPIILPDQDDGLWEYVTGTVIGWGREEETGTLSDVLRKVDVVLSNQTACRAVLHSLHHDLYPTHVCADAPEGGLGPCYGDYGGPLIIFGRVMAISSWGDACKALGNPYTVYTKVSPFVNWIFNTTGGPPPVSPAGSSGQSHQFGSMTIIYSLLVFSLYFLVK